MQTYAESSSEQFRPVPPANQMVVRRGGAATLRWALAAAGYAMLVAAWVFASPLGAAPDEPAHVVRAAGAAFGAVQGRSAAPYERSSTRTTAQAQILNEQAQEFTVPSDLLQPEPCFVGQVDRSAACVEDQPPPSPAGSVPAVTYETTAPPGVYVLAGLAMRLPQQALAAGYLGRVALALVCILLLAGAVWAACGRGSLWPLAGLSLAATPMTLFLGSALGTAGVTAAAALCFVTCLLAFWLGPPRAGLALVAGASGAVLALASAGGAVALAVLIVLVLPLVQLRRLTEPRALLASVAVTAALVAGLVLALDNRPLPPGAADLLAAVPVVVQSAPTLLEQAVGVFGRTDVVLPLAAYGAWGATAVIGVSAALVVGRWRDRAALVLGLGLALAMGVVAVAFLLAPIGWDLRGSFLLPVLAAVPVIAGFVLHAARVYPRADPLVVGVVVVGVQLLALWENARRYAVGRHGQPLFLDIAEWAPPGGWLPWLALAMTGGLLLLLSLAPLTRGEREMEAWDPLVVVDPISVSR